ncbi:DUF3291 domain-containing protein [Streptomyces sp. PT12]|uniref:DUF3291 domain-containing protein n=1 Tax=Streptomyces sp. PT12 TaxID=1510197 RepID=UPI000DE43EEA|nr:DUF3291 domain-containing protein [Streptomyces sp. PT12]RBM20678.1 DUF3291 domain-containing protein [Streptomyces sp. PT12]
MPTLPWTVPNPPPQGRQTVVMASRLEVRRLADVPRFFLRSLAAWRQVRKAPGAYGASLIAQPTKRTFWTLSAWESKEALYTYAKTEPHKSIMTGLRSVMRTSTFTQWDSTTDDLPISWDEARKRLQEQKAQQDGLSGTQ